MIFVFGSNEGGIHGAGAALYARKHKGAVLGKAFGLMGDFFAIPTKSVFQGRVGTTLPIEKIRMYVSRFIEYAEAHSESAFQVTRVGCGLAGFSNEYMAALFARCPQNCQFDSTWQKFLPFHKSWKTF